MSEDLETRLRGAWQGRVSGCMLGKASDSRPVASSNLVWCSK